MFQGSYRAIYLDEVKRTDNSRESLEFVKLNTKVRYGKYTLPTLDALKKMIASDEEVKNNNSEWRNASQLTAYHYHSDLYPKRTNADTSNAKSLVEHSRLFNLPIMVFKATHSPESELSSLEGMSAKEFNNLSNNLYLVSGSPIILTMNLNNELSLFNGARGRFIGPIYLRHEYEVNDYSLFSQSEVSAANLLTASDRGLKDFRHIMGMQNLVEVPGYKIREKLLTKLGNNKKLGEADQKSLD